MQGVPSDLLTMTDICRTAMPAQESDATKDTFCRCAGLVADGRITATEQLFIRLDPKRNFWTLVQLEPDMRRVDQCPR
ncbi:MAG: hypothetical protein WDN49_27710 [Acetobacteraceae bacterium]